MVTASLIRRNVEVSAAERAAVAELNTLDAQLYSYARERWHAQLRKVGLE